MDSISRPITEFCLDLYKKLNESAEDTNIVFSPMSISVALALIHLGAKNNTAAQIEKVSMNEPWWGASTSLAVPSKEMLGIPAQHMCEGLTGNLHKGRHRCCLHSCAWSTMIPALCWCESHPTPSKGWLRGGDTAQWGALAFPKPGAECQALFQNYGQVFPLVVATRILRVGVWVGRAVDTWRGCTCVAERISSPVPLDIQNVSPHRDPGGQGGGEEDDPSSHCAFTSCNENSAFHNLLFFSFFFSTMSGRRPIILRQSFLPGCGGFTFAVAARCPPRHSESVLFAQRPPLQPPGYLSPATSLL